jgi:hypothetical protein
MKSCFPTLSRPTFAFLVLLSRIWAAPETQTSPAVVDLNTPRDFPAIASAAQWQARAQEIREQVLVSCGLWPLPTRVPLKEKVFGRIERDGYSIEKVYFQTYPGFFLAGNLYRPSGRGAGPFPGILNPHGHWTEGRFADNADGSIAARCISFARQGMVAFSYDMVGYNDTHFAKPAANLPGYNTHRQFATNEVNQLWSVSLMGLQTWNSIRALDFLESLPDVDRHRLACTGESGGGTQTFMLGAVDSRLAAQAPIVMVSHTMQGGCLCENAPGLRVRYSNMEIAAAPAPRPQLLVAASGDWTKDTLTVEGPAIGHIYQLLNAPDNFHYARFDFGHNYNQTSRETVYGWFDKWLLKQASSAPVKEAPYQKEPNAALRVWSDEERAPEAVSQEAFIASLIESHRTQWNSLVPHSPATYDQFKWFMLPAWRHTLQVDWPERATQIVWKAIPTARTCVSANLELAQPGEPPRLGLVYFGPPANARKRADRVVVLVDAAGTAPYVSAAGEPQGLAGRLVQQGCSVLLLKPPGSASAPSPFGEFFTTYNRTELQARVGELLTACAQAYTLGAGPGRRSRVVLCGLGRAGLWALLAAPAADATLADSAQLNENSDESLLAPDLFCPGLRIIGGFEGAAMLAAPKPLLVCNTGANFSGADVSSAYQALGAGAKFRRETRPLSETETLNWIMRVK